MYTERLPYQVTNTGQVINPINHIDNEKTDEDFFRATIAERTRILNLISKPCPADFPKELRPLWKGNLEFSLTPCQSGWMQLIEKNKRK
mgnify:CR=1 FL=1